MLVSADQVAAARALRPIYGRQVFSRTVMLFDRVAREQLRTFGEVRTPSIADLFVALIGGKTTTAQGVAA